MHYSDHPNLIAALQAAARQYPERRISVFDGRCRLVLARDFAGFVEAGQIAAGRLADLGVGPGDRVVIALANGWDWLEVWLGCVWLGAWPVATSPGFAMGSAGYREEKTFGIARLLEARLVVAGDLLRDRAGAQGVTVVTPQDLAARGGHAPPPHEAKPDEIAYLQLTSGSTGVPKAAEITHGAMMHNIWAMYDAATRRRGGARPLSGTTWLPLFHDFGLVMTIGGVLNGVEASVFPPNAYLSRPAAWLRHLGTLEAPMCGSPNFGLHHAVTRVREEDLARMDLSGWHTCFVGAEMSRAHTLQAFLDKFAAAGCPPAMLAPSYGMAEATLGITLDQRAVGLRTGRSEPDAEGQAAEVVNCGAPLQETELRVVGKDGLDLPDGHVGEVLLRSGGMIRRYFRNPEATKEAMADSWLKTGDLGFLRDGEIYLTGRIKEILIIGGTNYMPDELEQLAEGAMDSAGMDRAAAFSVPGNGAGEVPVLVVEVDRRRVADPAALAEDVSGRIARELGLTLQDVVMVPRGTIPRTTSGKLQRSAARAAYLDGTLEPL
ncbi:MAG: AMP-binding protein [Marinibacterium sp.]